MLNYADTAIEVLPLHMDPERYEQVVKIFGDAAKRAPSVRAQFLAEACGDDEDLRRQV